MKTLIKNSRGRIALLQVIVLVIAVFAFAWMVGSEIENVRAGGNENENEDVKVVSPAEKVGCFGIHGTCVSPGFCSGTINFEAQCSGGQICCQTEAGGDINVGEFLKEGVKDAAIVEGSNQVKKKLFPKGILKGKSTAAETSLLGEIVVAAAYAVGTAMIITYFAKKYSSERNARELAKVTWIGAGAGISVVTIGAILAGEASTGPPGWVAAAVTAVFAGMYMLVGYQTYSREIFNFYPALWQPPLGGDDCQKCNELTLPNGDNGCSEYICHSYGQACEWINEGTDYETCIENEGNGLPPEISPAEKAYGKSVFPNEDYSYRTSEAGAKIVYSKGKGNCVPPFTSIILALETNEEAHCKISLEGHTGNNPEEIFQDYMKDMQEGNINTKIHTLNLPTVATASDSSLEESGYILRNGGNFNFYVRCQDVQGNLNTEDYSIGFCVQDGPDTWPPEIIGTKPEQEEFIKYGTQSVENVKVYLNEPADCRWDFERKSYSSMNFEFEKCSQNINDPIEGNYRLGCEGDFTGFQDEKINKYYISCLDQPGLKEDELEKRNQMEPYELSLTGTYNIGIDNIKINGKPNNSLIIGNENLVKVKLEVETSQGAEEGNARCEYSDDLSAPRTYALFGNKGNREYTPFNEHNLYLGYEEGKYQNYQYFIRCFDIAGNYDTEFINFSVEVDDEAPIVVRAFRSGDYLKIITDEPATCVYSIQDNQECKYAFDDGIPMKEDIGLDSGLGHLADWNLEDTFYIKCEDRFGKKLDDPLECNIIVRPFEIFEPI